MPQQLQAGPTRFTSESVTEGHPDKLADAVADAILDAILAKDPLARVGCGATVTTGLILVAGQITTDCYVDIPRIIRATVRDCGYTRAKFGFDAETCGVLLSIDEQSPDIATGVSVGGAGDSGNVFGFATDETPDYLPTPIVLAHRLAQQLAEARRGHRLPYLRPDGKVQLTVRYDDGKPAQVESVVVAAQHHDEVPPEQLQEEIAEQVVRPVLATANLEASQILVNPAGRFVIGGPVANVGVTGRQQIVDTYGGWARHGGGGFSGKDPTKIDRAGGYGARYVAKNLVGAGFATQAEIQLTYAIGVVKPVAVRVDTAGTGQVPDSELERAVQRVFDLSPLGIIKELNLRRPLYRSLAAYGHFGRPELDLPWERLDKIEDLKAEVRTS
ncbi:MAG: methionine adenosyltransferase [Candidatus Dormibacteraceae bacterium]